MISPNELDETVPVSNPDARKLLGIAHCGDPDQVARRMVRAGVVPHLRIGRRIRFSLAALRTWAAEGIANSVTQKQEAQEQDQSFAAAA